MSGHWDMQNNQAMKEDVEELLDQAFDAIEELMESLDAMKDLSNPARVDHATARGKALKALSKGQRAKDAINRAIYEDL